MLVVALLGGGAYYALALRGTSPAGDAGATPPGGVPVSVATVLHKPVVRWSQFSGMLEAVHATEIRPQVSGQITEVAYKDGDMVKKGQLLFTIDPRPYEAARISARGTLAEATAALARAKKLVGSKAISRAELDAAQSAYDRALGNDKAAEVNLSYTSIAAPISGKISRAELTVGNLVQANNPPLLASIVALSPIYASFDVDEQTYLRRIQGVPAAKLKEIPVEVTLSNGGAPLVASIHAFDNQITPGSGTIRVRALLANKDASLIPGLYARVQLGSADTSEAILINPAAIGTDQSKKFVMVVGADHKAEYREVTLGGSSEGLTIIETGLSPEEQVVVSGLQRVQRPGTTVSEQRVDMRSLAPLDAAPATPAAADAPAAPTPATEAK